MRVAIALAVAAASGAGAAAWASAEATNGEIFYTAGGRGTFVAPDGSGSRTPRVGRGDRARYLGEGGPVAFSPSGRRVAFMCSSSLTPRLWHKSLCTGDVDGTGLRRLTRAPKNSYVGDSQPAWSRDGKRIAFVRSLVVRNRPVYRIAIVNADGTGAHLVPEPSACRDAHDSQWPDWGPNGELVYGCENGSVDEGILLALDAEKAAIPLPCDGAYPQLSPDGRRILVSDATSFVGGVSVLGLATFSAAARTPEGLDPESCDWQVVSEAPFALSAVWSPDGTKVAFVDADARSLYVVGADGVGLRRIARSRGDIDPEIAWLPGAG